MITNRWIVGTDDLSEPLSLREAVFVDEQGAIPPDRDAMDDQALHLVLYDDSRTAACGRIYHNGRTFCLGRCCVAKDLRGQGLGDLLIKLLLLKVFEYGPNRVEIHAQLHAVPFYERYGFTVDGEPFIEDGIEHISMWVDKDSLRIPSKCGKTRRFDDFFEPAAASQEDG